MILLTALCTVLALGDGSAEALPLTDRILMVHVNEGHAVHHQKGKRRDEGEKVILTPLDSTASLLFPF